jgi:hypothetical protein
MTNGHDASAFEHPCPQSGQPHCHHVYPTDCHFCWDHLINRWAQAEMNRQDFAEMAEFGGETRRWADDRQIRDIPEEFQRLRTRDKEKDALVSELRSENEYLRSLLAKSPRKNKPWFR